MSHQKVLKVNWLRANYHLNDALTLTAAWYHYDQNSYAGNGCSNRSSSACSGNLDAYSAVLDYGFNKHFDTYGGIRYSRVADGLSSGYLFTSNFSPMVGFRMQF